MPEYDVTNYPTDTRPTFGMRTNPLLEPTVAEWPRSGILPDAYAGPMPDREFETITGGYRKDRPVADVPDPVEMPMHPVDPPSGARRDPATERY